MASMNNGPLNVLTNLKSSPGRRNIRRCLAFVVCLCLSISIYNFFIQRSTIFPLYCENSQCAEPVNHDSKTKEILVQPKCSCLFGRSLFLPYHQSEESVQEITNKDTLWNVPNNGRIMLEESLSMELLTLHTKTEQQIYLYEQLLSKQWNLNKTNLNAWRNELAKNRKEENATSHFIMHMGNVDRKRYIDPVMTKNINNKSSSSTQSGIPQRNPLLSRRRFKTCAVVGNSGSLKGSGCGTAIDNNDFVFRCNMPPLYPFKQDAGIRSNLTTMNPSILEKNYGKLKSKESIKRFNKDVMQYNGLFWVPCLAPENRLKLYRKLLNAFMGKIPEIVCGHPDHLPNTGAFWSQRFTHTRLSTGFYLITVATDICEEVNVFGFWPFSVRYEDRSRNLPYHYFDNAADVVAQKWHSMGEEFNVLVQLHNLGVVHVHPGSCIMNQS